MFRSFPSSSTISCAMEEKIQNTRREALPSKQHVIRSFDPINNWSPRPSWLPAISKIHVPSLLHFQTTTTTMTTNRDQQLIKSREPKQWSDLQYTPRYNSCMFKDITVIVVRVGIVDGYNWWQAAPATLSSKLTPVKQLLMRELQNKTVGPRNSPLPGFPSWSILASRFRTFNHQSRLDSRLHRMIRIHQQSITRRCTFRNQRTYSRSTRELLQVHSAVAKWSLRVKQSNGNLKENWKYQGYLYQPPVQRRRECSCIYARRLRYVLANWDNM